MSVPAGKVSTIDGVTPGRHVAGARPRASTPSLAARYAKKVPEKHAFSNFDVCDLNRPLKAALSFYGFGDRLTAQRLGFEPKHRGPGRQRQST